MPSAPRDPVVDVETLPDLLRLRAQTSPGGEALRFEGASLTWRELEARVQLVASHLRVLGVNPGDRVAIVVPNGLDFPVVWLAVPFLRAVAVPISVQYKQRDLLHLINDSGAVVAVTGKEQRPAVEEAQCSCPSLIHVRVIEDGAIESAPEGYPLPLDEDRAEPGDPVTIQYTSGTTGLPKGCVVDHGYWLRLARTIQEAAQLSADDVLLTAQPQSYMDPSWNLVIALTIGAPLVILPRFSASRFWAQVRENQVTFFYCIGTMPLYLLKQPRDPATDREHQVRLVYCSGIPQSVHQAMEDRWGCPWRETYGMTELGVVLLAQPGDAGSVGSGSMGRPVRGREVRVVDESGGGVAEGGSGELLVRGPNLMLGYFGDAEATAEWRQNGWVRTGDVVTRLPSGGFALVGRSKDMIRRAGENISAAEVEACLVEHSEVRAAACIPVPDELRKEEVKAYVQLVDGVSPGPAQAFDIHSFVAGRLASFKVPRYIEFIDAFPLTQSDKIAKAELRGARDDHRLGAWDAESQSGGIE